MKSRSSNPSKWLYVDLRVDPDGTCTVLFWPRENDIPTPLWTSNGEAAAPFDRDYKFPIPMIQREGISDIETGIKHAKIFDLYFGARCRMEEPDYGSLMSYLQEISPEAFRTLTDIARGVYVEEKRKEIEQSTPKDLVLEGERDAKEEIGARDKTKQKTPKKRSKAREQSDAEPKTKKRKVVRSSLEI